MKKMLTIIGAAMLPLLALALPASAQTNEEMFDALERLDRLENALAATKDSLRTTQAAQAKTDADVAKIQADLSTMKMNVNGIASKVDSFDAKLERAAKGQPTAPAWTEPAKAADWSNQSPGASYSSDAMMGRRRILQRLRDRRSVAISAERTWIGSGQRK